MSDASSKDGVSRLAIEVRQQSLYTSNKARLVAIESQQIDDEARFVSHQFGEELTSAAYASSIFDMTAYAGTWSECAPQMQGQQTRVRWIGQLKRLLRPPTFLRLT
jgi:hypothetical protein